jgi:DNA-binding FadR family transcriptional regulator
MKPTSLPPAEGNLSERVVRYLGDYIRDHRLQSGAQLPSEVRLSANLKISRGIVREAYRSLATAGVLEIANGRQPRVGQLSNRAFTQLLQHALATQQASRVQVFDVRSTLETRAAGLAAIHRTDEQAEAIRAEAAAMQAAGRRREPFVQADLRFHDLIDKATANPLFWLLASAVRESLDEIIRAGLHVRRTRGELARVVEVHVAIADAIAERDADQAERLMMVHFAEVREFALDGRPGRPPDSPRQPASPAGQRRARKKRPAHDTVTNR